MNKEKFIKMLESAKEDEYGRLYVLGEYNNKIYFGTITTICEDIFKLNHGYSDLNTSELYDRHFWNDDTFECYVVSNNHDVDYKYKEPKRIEELNIIAPTKHMKYMQDKINELVRISNKYAILLERNDDNDN